MTADSTESRTIKSDERLLEIIEVIREHDAVGVTEISSEIGLSKSTVHAHLSSLRKKGYIVRTSDGYRLGLEFLNHGKYVQSSYRLLDLAETKTAQLANDTGELVWCIVEENGYGYYLTGSEGKHSVDPPARIGNRDPLHCLAAGKAILANLPQERVDEIISRHGLTAETAHTITNRQQLADELEDIRTRGYAINDSEVIPGLYAIGAPILSETGGVHGALSISGPKNRLDASDRRERLIDLLRGATNEIEINIRGYRS